MGNNDLDLTQSDKDVLIFLLEVEKASAYTLAKNTDWSYSTMFTSTKRLEQLGLIDEIKETKSKRGGKKRLYQLSTLLVLQVLLDFDRALHLQVICQLNRIHIR